MAHIVFELVRSVMSILYGFQIFFINTKLICEISKITISLNLFVLYLTRIAYRFNLKFVEQDARAELFIFIFVNRRKRNTLKQVRKLNYIMTSKPTINTKERFKTINGEQSLNISSGLMEL